MLQLARLPVDHEQTRGIATGRRMLRNELTGQVIIEFICPHDVQPSTWDSSIQGERLAAGLGPT